LITGFRRVTWRASFLIAFEKEAPRQKGRTGNIVANYVYTYYKHIRDIDEYNQETIVAAQKVVNSFSAGMP
jgi:hypothetical protein